MPITSLDSSLWTYYCVNIWMGGHFFRRIIPQYGVLPYSIISLETPAPPMVIRLQRHHTFVGDGELPQPMAEPRVPLALLQNLVGIGPTIFFLRFSDIDAGNCLIFYNRMPDEWNVQVLLKYIYIFCLPCWGSCESSHTTHSKGGMRQEGQEWEGQNSGEQRH